ncbi:MAG: oligosaccharide flippase family protein [Candidatus Ancaeobacter aquaticus]|nr:oligosaccharide flippase family protein [Candidatus Ancaeobacter aquaticus]
MNEHASDNLVKHGSIMLAATLIAGFANYLYHVLMIRMLTPSEYGVLYSLLALFMIIGIPITTVAVVITKYVSKYRGLGQDDKISLLFVKSLKKLTVIGLLLFVLFVIFSKYIGMYLNIDTRIPIIIVGIVLALAFITTVTAGMLQGLQAFLVFGSVNIISTVGKVIFAALLVMAGFGVNGALWGIVISVIVSIIISCFPLKRYFSLHKTVEDVSIDKKEIYQYLVPVGIAIFCFGFLTYYDTLVVKHYFSPEVAGYYSTCALIGKAFLFPPAAFAGALFPKVSAAHSLGKKTFPLLKKALILIIAVLCVGLAICMIFPDLLINFLLKGKMILPEYKDTIITLMRYFGLMVIPYGLLCIIIYYNLALHRTNILYLLAISVAVLIGGLYLFHATLLQVICTFGIIGYLLFIISFIIILFTKEVEGEGVQGEDLYINAGIQ